MTRPSALKLSICIGTFNRAAFLRETLESIVPQVGADCEILVSDNASTDNTEAIVAEYARRCDQVRYFKQETNQGLDRNYDRAVELAAGEYCWLFSDDDLMQQGAVAKVLAALRGNYSLVLVNADVRDFDMSNVRVPNFFCIDADRTYAAGEMDRLFTDVGPCLVCICCVVIKRELWLSRDRRSYYDSWLIHVAVLLQRSLPGETFVMAAPSISLRLGNERTWADEKFQITFINWPSLVWSAPLSEPVKEKFCSSEPWKRLPYLLAVRALGTYSQTEYHRWVSPRLKSLREKFVPAFVVRLPRTWAYRLYVIYSLLSGRPHSPHDLFLSMRARSLRVLREDPPPVQMQNSSA